MGDEHGFDHYEHGKGGRIAACCRCGWKSPFTTGASLAGSALADHVNVDEQSVDDLSNSGRR